MTENAATEGTKTERESKRMFEVGAVVTLKSDGGIRAVGGSVTLDDIELMTVESVEEVDGAKWISTVWLDKASRLQRDQFRAETLCVIVCDDTDDEADGAQGDGVAVVEA
jgi:hypothetical protein